MEFFFRSRRVELGATQLAIARDLGLTEKSVANWERETVIPSSPIADLARVYKVSESRMEREVMALRRRIEARELAASK